MQTTKSYFGKEPLIELLTYVGAAVATLIAVVMVLRLWNADLRVPFDYTSGHVSGSGDAFWIFMLAKSLVDTGWVQTNPFLGAPVGMNLLDFPITEKLHLFLMKILAAMTGDFAVTVNLYFLAGFVLCALTAVAMARQAGLARSTSIAIALLYAILPAHFMRGQTHLFIGAYYMVPLGIMVCVWLAQGRLSMFPLKGISRRGIAALVICALSGMAYVYYAAFFVLFLVVTGLFVAMRQRSSRELLGPAVLIAVVLISFFINVSPNLLYRLRNGPNLMMADRVPEDAEDYALKLSQMVLPVSGHRVPALAAIRRVYDERFSLVNENSAATLGAVGTAGFLLLLWRIVRRFTGATENPLLDFLALMTLIGFLVGTMGGFGSVFNLLLFRLIRSYNRISVFLAGFSLLAVGFYVEYLVQRLKFISRPSLALVGLSIAIALIGLLDQTSPAFVPDYVRTKSDFQSDQAFIREVEAAVPAGGAIFQVPLMRFPESPVIKKLRDYQLFRGYLHSKQLRWSYGAMKGREIEAWQKKLESGSMQQTIAVMRSEKFAGLYIDTLGYDDSSTISVFQTMLNRKPIVSRNGRLAFFKFDEDVRP